MITVKLDDCEHIDESEGYKSYYNNNYYYMPESICGTNILFEHCDEFADTLHYYLVYPDKRNVLVFQDRWSSHPIIEIKIDDDGNPIKDTYWS